MKIAIICPDFQKSNLKKLPWKYVYEVAKYLSKYHEIMVITDAEKLDIDNLKVARVSKIFVPLNGESAELLDLIKKEDPDKCVMLLGLTSFLRREFKINKPVIGIFTSPPYKILELIKNIGIRDSIKYRKYTTIHYLNALIPNYFVKKWQEKFEKIVFLSDYSQKIIISKGLNKNKAVLIPLGLDETFFNAPDSENVDKLRKNVNPDKIPIIMYFTSPLTLRGTDTLVKAFAKVRNKMPCKLIFLSRMDYKELSKEDMILKDLAKKEGIEGSVQIVSKYLNSEEIKKYLSIADVVCLPFKIVISDVPVSILEVMALKRPLISTEVACIPEMVNKKSFLVKPNNSEILADNILKLLNNESLRSKIGNNSGEYMQNYFNWDDVGESVVKIIER